MTDMIFSKDGEEYFRIPFPTPGTKTPETKLEVKEMTNNLPENDDAPWLNLTPQEVEELRYNKQELTSYGREKIRKLMLKSQMTEDIQQPNGDFLKNYPDVTRVEVIGNDGREFVHYGCSNVKVSLQDDGRTIKVFLYTMFQQEESKPMDDAINRLENKYKKAEENAASYMTDEVIDRVVKKYQAQKLWNMVRNELGYSVDCVNEIVDLVEKWIPEPQNASGSQNVDTELLVDGFNDCVRKMKEMLR
jgi:hypothetical protein